MDVTFVFLVAAYSITLPSRIGSDPSRAASLVDDNASNRYPDGKQNPNSTSVIPEYRLGHLPVRFLNADYR